MPKRAKEPDPLNVSGVSVCVNWSGPAFATGARETTSVVDVVEEVVVVNVVVVNVPSVIAATMAEYGDAFPFSAARMR